MEAGASVDVDPEAEKRADFLKRFHLQQEKPDKMARFPARPELSRNERMASAAVCVLRATQGQPPTFCPPGLYNVFQVLNNRYYVVVLKLLVLVHILVVTLSEPPPRLYGKTDQQIDAAGYSVSVAKFSDVGICLIYVAHTFCVVLLDRARGRVSLHVKGLCALVFLLFVDMLANVGRSHFGMRPFRFLRPLVYVMLDPQQSLMLESCVRTFLPLVKTFVILVGAQLFYAIVGLNLFNGEAPDAPLGAACLTQAGLTHPFRNIQQAFYSMYVLATSDNHPAIVWPFYTCNCKFTSINETVLPSYEPLSELPQCKLRNWTANTFFCTYMVIVYFCLGNCVLAVCYFFFEKISKRNVMLALMRQKFSMIAAFHYLEDGTGAIRPQDFQEFCRNLRNYMHISPEKQQLLFMFLDSDSSGRISLKEFFLLSDLLQVKMLFHKNAPRMTCYATWKESESRSRLQRFLNYQFGALPVVDWVILLLVIINGLLAAMESTRTTVLQQYAGVTVWIFAGEAAIKILGLGLKTYWLAFWNKFDFCITVLGVLGVIAEGVSKSVQDNYSATLDLIMCLRLFKLLGVMQKLTASDGESSSYYAKLIESLSTTIPVCMNILLLLFFYMVVFAMIGMELLSRYDATSRNSAFVDGYIDYKYNNEFQYDWSDLGSSLWSVLIVIVGNTWSTTVDNAMSSAYTDIMWFFILFHFLGVFLMLNIMQSLFVFAFSTLLNEKDFTDTLESSVSRMVKSATATTENLKLVHRPARLEYLMTTTTEMNAAFEEWVNLFGEANQLNLDGILLGVSLRDVNLYVGNPSNGEQDHKSKRKRHKKSDRRSVDETNGVEGADGSSGGGKSRSKRRSRRADSQRANSQ